MSQHVRRPPPSTTVTALLWTGVAGLTAAAVAWGHVGQPGAAAACAWAAFALAMATHREPR